MLMKKASDPSVVREAFNAVGVPLDDPTEPPKSGVTDHKPVEIANMSAEQAAASQPDAEAIPETWRITCRDLSKRITESLTAEQLNRTAAVWFSKSSTREQPAIQSPPVPRSPTSLPKSIEKASVNAIDAATARLASLQQDPATATDDADQWATQLKKFRELWLRFLQSGKRPDAQHISTRSDEVNAQSEVAVFHRFMSDSLDVALLSSLKDAAFWKSQETTAFFRLLQRAEQGSSFAEHQNAPTVSTLQLEAESSQLRGRLVRFRGEVYRIEASSGDNPISQSQELFYKLWLRGEDRANQPVSIYCTAEQAANFDALPADGKSQVLSEFKPRVTAWGWVGKRMAYQAQSGIEVAPTLFATHIDVAAPDVLPPVAEDPDVGWKLAQIALAAAVTSFAIVWFMRSGQKRAAPIRRKSLLWLTIFLPHVNAAAQDNPTAPWAQTDESVEIRSVIQEPIDQAWQQETLAELQAHAVSPAGSKPLPDGVLKTIRTLNQISWKRALSLDRLTSSWIEMERSKLRGVAVGCEAVALTPTQLQWFQEDDLARLFRLKIKHRPLRNSGASSEPASDLKTTTVYCTRVPLRWLGQTKLKQPVSVEGFVLADSNAEPTPNVQTCMLSESASWILLPGTKPEALYPPLPNRMLALGLGGWDLANLNIVAINNQKPLSQQETKAYFSLMRCIGRVSQSLDFASATTKPTEILNSKPPKTGLALCWNVRLVSGTVVDVPLEDQTTLGSTRYFQMDGFVDLGDQRLTYLTRTDRGETREVTFEREFPITLVTTNTNFVPDDVARGSKSVWEIGKYMQASGVLYRLWAFRSDLIESRGASSLQAAPLVILADLEDSLPPLRQRSSSIGWFGAALCLVVLCLLALILYFAGNNDRRPKRLPIAAASDNSNDDAS